MPTKMMLSDFKVRLVGRELVKWKRKLKARIGVECGTKSFVPLSRRTQADMDLGEDKTPNHSSTSQSCEELKILDR